MVSTFDYNRAAHEPRTASSVNFKDQGNLEHEHKLKPRIIWAQPITATDIFDTLLKEKNFFLEGFFPKS